MPRILLPNGKAVFTENAIPDDQLEAFVASQMEGDKPIAPSMPIDQKRALRKANDSAVAAGIKDSDVNTDTYKGPDSFLGGFFNSINNSLKSTLGENEMLQHSARPVSTKDLLGLLIMQEAGISQALSGAKKLLGFGPKAAEVIPKVAKEADDIPLNVEVPKVDPIPEVVKPKELPKLKKVEEAIPELETAKRLNIVEDVAPKSSRRLESLPDPNSEPILGALPKQPKWTPPKRVDRSRRGDRDWETF